MFGILLIPNLGIVFADHDHDDEGGGGGCSGDCTPPTLGQDSSGVIHVTGGFTINGQTFDTEHFEQTITTQTVRENEPVEIILKVFENGGPQHLKHVGLVVGNEYIFDSYVWRHLPNAEIGWEQTFDGIQSVEIENSENLITDVNVKAEIDGTITILKFQFTPTTTFDASHIMVKMWDQNRSYWVNNFHNALEIKSNPFNHVNIGVAVLPTESEIHEEIFEIHEDEHESHTPNTEEIHCSTDSTAILDTRFGSVYCTPDNFATALIESGLATAI